jgi:hypothetical protein
MGAPGALAKIHEIYAGNSFSGRHGVRNVSPLILSANKLFDVARRFAVFRWRRN